MEESHPKHSVDRQQRSPSNSVPVTEAVTGARQRFVSRLRVWREHRGLSLEAVARTTKIRKAYFVALERNDLSTWPSGIFRRAYLRSYAAAIDLPPDDAVTEFNELFPEAGDRREPSRGINGRQRRRRNSTAASLPLRLMLADSAESARAARIQRAMVAGGEAVALLLAAAALILVTGGESWTSGLLILLYFPIAMACLGETVALRLFAPAWRTAGRYRPRRNHERARDAAASRHSLWSGAESDRLGLEPDDALPTLLFPDASRPREHGPAH